MAFRRISSLVNPYAEKLLHYPGKIYPFFDSETDATNFKLAIEKEVKEIFLEYGSGSGGHLLSLAKLFPEHLCVGFEIRFKRAVRTIEKAEEENISNVVIARTRGEIAGDLFEKNKLAGIFINFPDPWEKKRWLKHRILTAERIEAYLPLLKDTGFLSIKTDHQGYFSDFLDDLNSSSNFGKTYRIISQTTNLERSSIKFSSSLDEGFVVSSIESEFEKLFRGQSKPIGYCLIEKVASV